MTIKEGITNSKIGYKDSLYLLSCLLQKDASYLLTHDDDALRADIATKWQIAHDRRLSGEPIAYIVNRKEFFGHSFYVDQRVLIPRPETEGLVEKAVVFAKGTRCAPLSILEIGVGSGAVIISLYLELVGKELIKNVEKMVATDISDEALSVAQKNMRLYRAEDVIELRHGSLFEPVEGEKFDIILANLPYVPKAEALSNLFEPQTALDGGESGSELIGAFLTTARSYLKPHGIVIYEMYGGAISSLSFDSCALQD